MYWLWSMLNTYINRAGKPGDLAHHTADSRKIDAEIGAAVDDFCFCSAKQLSVEVVGLRSTGYLYTERGNPRYPSLAGTRFAGG